MSSERPAPFNASDFPHFGAITTRWMDNDVYGHVNNVVYYSFFDTVVADYLIAQGALDFIKAAPFRLLHRRVGSCLRVDPCGSARATAEEARGVRCFQQ